MSKTKQEAAEYLGVSTRAVENYAAKGRLSVTYTKGKRGQIALFDDEELQKLKDELTQPIYPQRGTVVSSEQPRTQAIVPFAPSAPLVPQDGFKPMLDAYRRFVPVAEKLMLTLAEAQALTNLSRDYLLKAIHEKKLKAQLIGRGWKIKREHLEDFIKKL